MTAAYLSLQGQRRKPIMLDTSRRGADRASRLARAAVVTGTRGKVCPADRATQLLEAIIEPGDRVTLEGDNQKQADFLASPPPWRKWILRGCTTCTWCSPCWHCR